MAKNKPPKMGSNEEHVAFYHEVGMAITQWAMVENALFNVVAAGIKDKKQNRLLALGFFSIESFHSKCKYANLLIEERFSDSPYFGNWKPLFNKLDTLSKKRNQLAHRQVRVYANNIDGKRYALIPWLTKAPIPKGNIPKPSSDALCLQDVVNIRFEFSNLHNALMDFAFLLSPWEVHGLKTPLPEVKPQKIHDIVHQIHSVLGHSL